jgi:hypothetical protein
MERVGMTTLWLGRHVTAVQETATFSAFLPLMQFVIVSEVEFVDKLREL